MRPAEIVGARFEIVREAGAGGMGTVYRARDLRTGGSVAIKVMQGQGASAVARFEQEAEVLSQLEHPGIVRYVAHGTGEAGETYLAMEWLEGEDLEQRLARGGLLASEGLGLVARAAEALAAAHARGVVHRDIKPSNLFLVDGNPAQIKLLDFGIARLRQSKKQVTQLGTWIGTLGYMAPEQARGERDVEPAADVFSLGCVLFECLTGKQAFGGEHPMAVLAKILLEQAPKVGDSCPEARGPLEGLVARMLSKDPSKRPADAEAVLRELSDLGRRGATLDDARSSRQVGALTAGEQRLVSVILAGGVGSEARISESRAVAPTDISGPTMAAEEPTVKDSVRALAQSFSARIEPLFDGSLVVSLSGSGIATDQAARAAACALALRAEMPGVPMALVTGRAELRGRLPVGEALDRGAQLLVSPVPGAPREQGGILPIRMDEITAGLLDSRFDVAGDPTGLLLHGQKQHEAMRTLLGKPTPHVGRDAELSMLEAVLAHSIGEPVARVVVVTAAAGVGKSRLKYEFLKRVQQGTSHAEVWVARGDPMRAGSAFGLLSQALAQTAGLLEGEAPEVRRKKLRARVGRNVPGAEVPRVTEFLGEITGAAFPGEESVQLRAARQDARLMGDQIRRAWEDFVEAESGAQPVLLVLEDLHWGDLPTVSLVDAALRRCLEKPLLVLALARPEVADLFPGLWADWSPQAIRLSGLTRKPAQRLVRSVLGEDADPDVVARLVDQASGNAFYLEELVRAVAEGKGDALPGTVLAMVQARLLSIEPEARRILRAASVFGQTFSAGGVAALLGGTVESTGVSAWLHELSRLELISPVDELMQAQKMELGFRHALVREAAYGMLTESDRELGHRLAAEHLSRTEGTDSMVLAEHFERGGEPARAVRWYCAAAEQALEGNDFAVAINRADKALQCGAAGIELGAVRLVQAHAHRWCGETGRAHACAREAMSLLYRGDEKWCAAAAEVAIGASRLGDMDGLEEVGRTLLSVLTIAETTSHPGQVIAAARTSGALFVAGKPDLAETLLQACASAHDKLASKTPMATAWMLWARAYEHRLVMNDPSMFLDFSTRTAAAFEQAGASRDACSQRVSTGYAYMELGAFGEAEKALREALAVADRMGLTLASAFAKNNLGWALARQGRLAEAERVELEAIEAFQKQGDKRMEGNSRVYLASIRASLGNLEEARKEASLGADLLEAAPPQRAFALAIVAQVALAQDDAKAAHDAARKAMEHLDELGSIEEGESLVRLVFAQALDAVGDYPAAQKAISRARDRLLVRTTRLGLRAWRESFLRNVPENARSLALAMEWLGEETLDSSL